MKNKKELHCSECGALIENICFKCMDECLIVNFFDTDEENCFCSKECFCKYLSLEKLEVEENSINDTRQKEV